MKLAIVGSTALSSSFSKSIIESAIDKLNPDTIMSGEAGGIDSLAKEVAIERKLCYKGFPPAVKSWKDQNGLKGYQSRNKEIAEACDALLRIAWNEEEQKKITGKNSFGSGWTKLYAEKLGKKTIEFFLTLQQDKEGIIK